VFSLVAEEQLEAAAAGGEYLFRGAGVGGEEGAYVNSMVRGRICGADGVGGLSAISLGLCEDI